MFLEKAPINLTPPHKPPQKKQTISTFFLPWKFQAMTTKDLPTRVPPLSRRPLFLVVGKWTKKTGGVVLLVEEIPHQLIGALSHYLQGFYTASINSISMVKQTAHFLKLIHPKPKPDHMVVYQYLPLLGGGWTNPFEKYVRDVGSWNPKV